MDPSRFLLTAEELALRVHVRPGTIRTWARLGRIPVVRLSPKVMRFDFEAVVASRRVSRSSEAVPPAGTSAERQP